MKSWFAPAPPTPPWTPRTTLQLSSKRTRSRMHLLSLRGHSPTPRASQMHTESLLLCFELHQITPSDPISSGCGRSRIQSQMTRETKGTPLFAFSQNSSWSRASRVVIATEKQEGRGSKLARNRVSAGAWCRVVPLWRSLPQWKSTWWWTRRGKPQQGLRLHEGTWRWKRGGVLRRKRWNQWFCWWMWRCATPPQAISGHWRLKQPRDSWHHAHCHWVPEAYGMWRRRLWRLQGIQPPWRGGRVCWRLLVWWRIGFSWGLVLWSSGSWGQGGGCEQQWQLCWLQQCQQCRERRWLWLWRSLQGGRRILRCLWLLLWWALGSGHQDGRKRTPELEQPKLDLWPKQLMSTPKRRNLIHHLFLWCGLWVCYTCKSTILHFCQMF